MKDFITTHQATDVLNAGGVVAVPTETVYGLAAKINSEIGLKKVFETKDRPLFDPLIVHVNSIEMINNYISKPDPLLLALAKKFWPGPLTIVFQKNPNSVSDLVTAGADTVAIRWADHPVLQDIITIIKVPIAAPSANPFKKTSPTDAIHVRTYFPYLDIVDGGPCKVGLESTIVRISNKKLEVLRPGQISCAELRKFLKAQGLIFEVVENFDLSGPGSMKDHYQPNAPLHLFQSCKIDYNLFQDTRFKEIKLNPDPQIASRFLYKNLIENSKNFDVLIIEWDKDADDPNWSAILNRLKKAAKEIY